MSLRRGQAVLPNPESRPLPRDNKKLGILKRWASHGISFRRQNTSATMATSSSSSLNSHNLRSTSHNHQHFNNNNNNNNKSSIKHMATYYQSHHVSLPSASVSVPASSSALTSPLNIMHWMQNDCPNDVVPLILAFAGPQRTAVIGRTNRFWRHVVEKEATWRRLCEELYKWKEGDEIPNSWKKYYQYNPCVPVDYSTIHNALGDVIGKAKEDPSKPSTVRVLLRPGRYVLREAITVDEAATIDDNGSGINHSLSIAIETMEYSPGNCHNSDLEDRCSPARLPSQQSKRKRKKSIRNIFQCRTVDVETEDVEEDVDDDHSMNDNDNDNDNRFFSSEGGPANANRGVGEGGLVVGTPIGTNANNSRNRNGNTVVNRATLVLMTRRHNEPLLRIRQGSCTIRNIDLKHGSLGNDIWNGNSAIQIQPPIGPNDEPLDLPAPTATLDRVDVTSSSGRGIVNIDGGHVKISNSYIHDCAATGIYVGGLGSRATIEQSDVLYNGKGNTRHRRGIARGHSGIYLEQGHASIIDCNVSRNVLTGISVISPDNGLLCLQESDLVSNGTIQLEMPSMGTMSHRNSVTVNNNLAFSGMGRSRSGLVVE